MSLENLKSQIPDYAKDIRLNLSSVLTPEGAPDLTPAQIAGIALASAYSTKNQALIENLTAEFSSAEPAIVNAAKAAASIMGMNNVYYRFIHLAADSDIKTLPAKLRMNVMAAPGIDKADFELMSLAISAINGCGMCMESHVAEVKKHGITSLGVQSSIRIAAVVNAAAQALVIG